MPSIQSLHIQNFRNLSDVILADLGPVNLFWGNNGSGKTSLLEAIYFAATGRSFRSSQVQHAIQHHSEGLGVQALVSSEGNQMRLTVQRKTDGSKQIHWDGKKISGFAPVAQSLPIQFVSTLSYRFFTDGPKVRRQFFDWLMFHVKPCFYKTWKEWQRLLQQRNSCLRQRRPSSEVFAWDKPLSELAAALDDSRQTLIEAITPILHQHLQLLSAPFLCQLEYDRGWDKDLTLQQVLREQIGRDYQLGYTSAGPQRADFQLNVEGIAAGDVLSQGQQKLAMYAMHLSQGYFLRQETERRPIYLIDDMASELDPRTQHVILDHLINGLSSQLFLTGITRDIFPQLLPKDAKIYQLQSGVLTVPQPIIA